MELDLISKKELLDFTGISYGQLYRWKRKGLIPEEWFIRRATFTGQETFFPREKMLSRVEKIKDMKEDISLDDIAGVFSPESGDIRLSDDDVINRDIAGGEILGIYAAFKNGEESYGFDDLVFISMLKRLFDTGGVGRDEAAVMLEFAYKNLDKFKDGYCEVYAVRKLGVFSCFMAALPCEIKFEDSLKVIAKISVPAVKEDLKLKLM